TGDDSAPSSVRILSLSATSVRQTTFPVFLSIFTKELAACMYTWFPTASGDETQPNPGTGVPYPFGKSTLQRISPLPALKHTRTSPKPAAYRRCPSKAGVDFTQLPCLLAASRTDLPPGHEAFHSSRPVTRSSARTLSVFSSVVSKTKTRS